MEVVHSYSTKFQNSHDNLDSPFGKEQATSPLLRFHPNLYINPGLVRLYSSWRNRLDFAIDCLATKPDEALRVITDLMKWLVSETALFLWLTRGRRPRLHLNAKVPIKRFIHRKLRFFAYCFNKLRPMIYKVLGEIKNVFGYLCLHYIHTVNEREEFS